MFTKSHKIGLAVGGGLALVALVAAAQAQPRLPAQPAPAQASPAEASFAKAAAALEAAGYRIREMDRDGGGFEVEATARDGRRVELDVGPGGQVLRERADD